MAALLYRIKLFFTNRPYYKQLKNYDKRQKAVRKILRKKSKNFCPWSGYYIHDILVTMLKFYHKTYEAKDCCWSETERTDKIATELATVLYYADELERIDNLETEELVKIAEAEEGFDEYIESQTTKFGVELNTKYRGYYAYSFLEQLYTKRMYSLIGEHIWEWCD